MNPTKHRWLWLMALVWGVSIACNLLNQMNNPAGQVVEQIEEIATQVDLDEVQTMITEIPTDYENLQQTAEAFAEGFNAGEVPDDIPLVEEEVQNIFSSSDFVSYQTPMPFPAVVSFYQQAMVEEGWKLKKQGMVISQSSAVLPFQKANRRAIVTLGINPLDGTTAVLISIQAK